MAIASFDYMPPSYGSMEEDEEERRRREAEEAAQLAGPAVPDLTQQQPAAATDFGAMPEATEVAPAMPEMNRSFETEAAAPTGNTADFEMVNGKLVRKQVSVVPAMPGMPAEPAPVAETPPPVQMPQLPQPGPGVQVAGPAQMPPAAPAAVEAPAVPGTGFRLPGQQPAASQQPYDMFLSAANDTDRVNKLMGIRNDELQSPVFRRIASAEVAADLSNSTKETDARDQIGKMSQTELARELQRKDSEGSWKKRILFGMLGMEAAVKDEEAKLGIGAKWTSTSVSDPKTGQARNVLVKTRADGLPMLGYDAESGAKLDAKALASLPSGTAKLNIVGGTVVNDKTGEVGRVVSDERTGLSYVQTDTGRKPMSGFRPQASAGTLDMQRVAQIQRQNVDLAGDWAKLQMKVQGAAPEAANKFLGEFNAKHRTNYGLSQLQGSAPQISLETGQMSEAPAAPAPAAAAPAQTAQAQTAPAQTAQTAPAQTAQAAPAQTQARPPAASAAGGRVAGGGVATGGVATGGSVSPAQLEQQMALGKKAAETNIETGAVVQRERLKPPAAAEGQQLATDVKNQGFADRTYGLMQQINQEIAKSTGSTIGAGVDTVAAALGKSTEGSKAIARLNVLSYNILANIPRFEGPQSDIDVQMYKQAAGDFNNRKLPVEDRLAALGALNSILQRYDKAGKNDWTFGAGQQGGSSSGTTQSGNKFKRVQ